jgi:hypothetical protein
MTVCKETTFKALVHLRFYDLGHNINLKFQANIVIVSAGKEGGEEQRWTAGSMS